MSYKVVKDQERIPYQALLNENNTLRDEIKDLRIRLEEAEELRRAISEGDLDALVIPGPEGEMIFTLDSADHAYRVLVETMNEVLLLWLATVPSFIAIVTLQSS